jgi:catechol 2,3-dioxygenase-like lactoylglutathione lyase family enzyme
MNINHLHLKVASVERAQRFYARFFGLKPSVWHGDMLFMRDEAGMDLALAPAKDPEPLPEWFHFGFRLESPDAVTKLHDEMAGAGVPLKAPLTREDDLTFFRCLDPDGHDVEIYWEPEPAAG